MQPPRACLGTKLLEVTLPSSTMILREKSLCRRIWEREGKGEGEGEEKGERESEGERIEFRKVMTCRSTAIISREGLG